MTYYNRLITLVLFDAMIVVTAVFLSYWLLNPLDEIPAFALIGGLVLLLFHYFYTAF